MQHFLISVQIIYLHRSSLASLLLQNVFRPVDGLLATDLNSCLELLFSAADLSVSERGLSPSADPSYLIISTLLINGKRKC